MNGAEIDFGALTEPVARSLLGEPNEVLSTNHTLRFGNHGSLAVEIAGRKRGAWHDFERGTGGGVLELLEQLAHVPHDETVRWLRTHGFLDAATADPAPHGRPAPSSRPERPEAASTIPLARRLWAEGASAAGSPVGTYLRSRGLTLPGNAPLRFHPACPRGTERLPAMLALMSDPAAGQPCGVHRTFLRPGGRGKVEGGLAKMMAGRAGIVRLVPDTEVALGLGIAEGIETSLAIIEHAGWSPVWACASAGGISRFPVLSGIECITIFADRDDQGAGLAAANACAERWIAAGREATIEMPPSGTDWLDALSPRRAA